MHVICEKPITNNFLDVKKLINLAKSRNLIIFDTKNIKKKNIFWGITNKTQYEIIEFEKDISINRRYKLGLYDCRHFVNEFTIWCLGKETPIWKLKNLWNNIN